MPGRPPRSVLITHIQNLGIHVEELRQYCRTDVHAQITQLSHTVTALQVEMARLIVRGMVTERLLCDKLGLTEAEIQHTISLIASEGEGAGTSPQDPAPEGPAETAEPLAPARA